MFNQDLDVNVNGTGEVDLPRPFVVFEELFFILLAKTYSFGPWVLLHVLEMKLKFATKDQLVQWLLQLYDKGEPKRHSSIEERRIVFRGLYISVCLDHEEKWPALLGSSTLRTWTLKSALEPFRMMPPGGSLCVERDGLSWKDLFEDCSPP